MKRTLTPLAALAVCCLTIGSAEAKTFNVKWGDTLDVPHGHYRLTGDLIGDAGTAITITADHVVLDLNGYTIRGGVRPDPNRPGHFLVDPTSVGVWVKGASNVQIKKGKITRFFYGVLIDDANRSQLKECVITDNFRGVWLKGNSARNQIKNNDVFKHECCGIRLDASNNTVKSNVCTDNTTGIFILGNSNEVAGNNTDDNNMVGIWVFAGANNVISGNAASMINRAPGAIQVGIALGLPKLFGGPTFAIDTLVIGNTALGNHAGGFFQYDLLDTHLMDKVPPACENAWMNNIFIKDHELGADAGPGAGCIQ